MKRKVSFKIFVRKPHSICWERKKLSKICTEQGHTLSVLSDTDLQIEWVSSSSLNCEVFVYCRSGK